MAQDPRYLLNEVSDWKLEAKFEDSSRYFYDTSEASKIQSGRKFFVIGRKGIGKTALSEHLKTFDNKTYNGQLNFAHKLSFKGFPFNDLYASANNSFTAPNQYITIWKYVIYSYICKMMARNNYVNYDARVQLQKLYGESESKLSNLLPKWTATDFDFKLFGSGVKIGGGSSYRNPSWIEKVNILEEFIFNNIDESRYYILFDELDEDYKDYINYDKMEDYLSLLTSLFKAVQDIRGTFFNKKNVFPIIFLRDDIYEFIKDSDKTKWNDFRVDLDWDKTKIKDLLSFRISRAIDRGATPMGFDVAWSRLFTDGDIGVGARQKNKISIFEFITRSTQLRPRDYIRYFQAAAERQLDFPGDRIGGSTVKQVDKAFSNYLKSELEDEIAGVIPDIKYVFDIISQLRKQQFTVDEFKSIFAKHANSGSLKTTDSDLVLKFLYHFSVLGNYAPRVKQSFFRYNNREARLNFNEPLILHRGLFKALQVDTGILNYNN